SELQANCLAGVFLGSIRLSYPLSDGDLEILLADAAATADREDGDEDERTHGSADNSVLWTERGWEEQTPGACNTWDVEDEELVQWFGVSWFVHSRSATRCRSTTLRGSMRYMPEHDEEPLGSQEPDTPSSRSHRTPPSSASASGPHNCVELRVHGVSGGQAEELLDVEPAMKVGGDRLAGFFRWRRETDTETVPGVRREIFAWGNLTSGSAS